MFLRLELVQLFAQLQFRREKIAERMKNMQELVPNSNKVFSSRCTMLSLKPNWSTLVLFLITCPGCFNVNILDGCLCLFYF